ncbi:MAG: hydroxyethylthiazole kinase [Kiritimatiellae bacterium]|jgi:hydroxyethylthiazole kinase|nr:hydroxyethylthiazole kinase [Kiritimatiellia bacterium]
MKTIFENVKIKNPLIHHITNYVTVNDCANIQIACGGSPIMADCVDEMVDMSNICQGLVLNIGTLNHCQVESMILAGKAYNKQDKSIILDPVGCGATKLRTDTTFKIIEELELSIIRGNLSEIKTIYGNSGNTKGVDAAEEDQINVETIEQTVDMAKTLAKTLKTIIVITGKMDVVTDGTVTYVVKNGHSSMANVSGTGCMLTSILCAYICANPDNPVKACAVATGLMGLAGKIAYDYVNKKSLGNASLKVGIIDTISTMTTERLNSGLKIDRL